MAEPEKVFFNPYPKSEPKPKKKPGKIRAMTDKRITREREKKRAYSAIEVYRCSGCGTTQGLSRSHTIPISKRPDLIGHPDNIEVMCMERCHLLVENCSYWLLENGEQVVRKMLRLDPQIGIGRIWKMKDRLTESETNPDDLPEWVSEVLNLLK